MSIPRLLFAPIIGLCIVNMASGQDSTRFSLSSGIYVDRDTNQLFVMEPGIDQDAVSGVSALSIRNGEVQWTNEALTVPLIVNADNQLVGTGRAGIESATFPLIAVDEKNGEVSRQLEIPLSPGLTYSPTETVSGSLSVLASEQDGNLILNWRYSGSNRLEALPRQRLGAPADGPVPPSGLEGVADPDVETTNQTYRVDFESGEVVEADNAEPEQGGALENLVPENALELQPQQRPIPGIDLPQFLSADSRHVIARQRTRGAERRYLHQVFEVESEEKIGEFASDSATFPYFVADSDEEKIIVLEMEASFEIIDGETALVPPRVMAMKLSDGEQVWSRPIAERQFTGKLPH